MNNKRNLSIVSLKCQQIQECLGFYQYIFRFLFEEKSAFSFFLFFFIRFKKSSQDFASSFWGLSIMMVIGCDCEIFLIEVS